MKTLRALVLAAALLVPSCGPDQARQVTVAGSTSVHPFVEMLAEEFMARHPDERVLVQGGGSTAGIQAVRDDAAAIGMVSRALHAEENDLKAVAIARDSIAVIVHPSNPVNNLTREQIRDIFSGLTADFSKVGGRKEPVRPVTREEGSGTRGAFQELVMEGKGITPEALVQDSNGSMRELIANDPSAIGYISFGLANKSVKVVSIDGVPPTRETVRNGTYKFVRPFLFVTKAAPEGVAKQFIEFVLSSESQRLLEEEGLIAVK